MQTFKKWLPRVALALIAMAMGAVLTRTFLAGPSDAPQPKNFKAADRTALSQDGAPDFRGAIAPPGTVAGQGIIEPRDREVKVGAAVSGVIAKIFVNEGDSVKAGTPLIELQDDVERAAVQTAQAQLEKASAGARREEREALGADARSAEARAQLSQINARRIHGLFLKGAATEDDDDKAAYQTRIDQAAAAAAGSRSEQAHAGWRLEVAVSQGQLDEAQAQLGRLTVRAPSDGTILQLVVRAGEFYSTVAQTSSPLLTIGDLTRIRARLDLDERDVAAVRLGQRGFVTAEAFGDRKFPGTVVDIARRMGRKNLRSDEPTERIDTKIREVVLELDDGHELVQGLRVSGFLAAPAVVAKR